jgi:nucleoside 2-deoxyribosyltransferase
MYEAVEKLRALGHNVYAPIEHVVENAWDWPNTEWGLQVFRNDVNAIKDSDFVIVLTWGRLDTSSGTTWEQGFAYGVGKKVILVEMDDSVQSLMVANGRFATVKGIDGLCGYDFNDPKPLRTETEQK